jgi:hypothetical protein
MRVCFHLNDTATSMATDDDLPALRERIVEDIKQVLAELPDPADRATAWRGYRATYYSNLLQIEDPDKADALEEIIRWCFYDLYDSALKELRRERRGSHRAKSC